MKITNDTCPSSTTREGDASGPAPGSVTSEEVLPFACASLEISTHGLHTCCLLVAREVLGDAFCPVAVFPAHRAPGLKWLEALGKVEGLLPLSSQSALCPHQEVLALVCASGHLVELIQITAEPIFSA